MVRRTRLLVGPMPQSPLSVLGLRRYIHENLSYRFVMLSNGAAAYAIEAMIKNGEREHGRPLLNPGG